MEYDVIVPIATPEALFIHKVVPYMVKNILGRGKIYLITSRKNFCVLSNLLQKYPECQLIDEDNLVDGLTMAVVRKFQIEKYGRTIRPGWYFQQFLKMGFALSEYARGYYLSWDADTIPLRNISFFEEGHPVFDMKTEYHKPYFDTLQRILDLNKISKGSFIAEHMLFKADVMCELIKEIESPCSRGETWVKRIIDATDHVSAGCDEMFSEFETYGTYCMSKYPTLYGTRTLNTFRGGGYFAGRMINAKLLDALSWDLDTISFELHSCPPFPMSMVHRCYLQWVKWMVWYINKKKQ